MDAAKSNLEIALESGATVTRAGALETFESTTTAAASYPSGRITVHKLEIRPMPRRPRSRPVSLLALPAVNGGRCLQHAGRAQSVFF